MQSRIGRNGTRMTNWNQTERILSDQQSTLGLVHLVVGEVLVYV